LLGVFRFRLENDEEIKKRKSIRLLFTLKYHLWCYL